MNIVTLDFESFFDDEYSLRKMTTEAYVRDPRFLALGVSIAAGGERPYWVPRDQISGHLAQFDWSRLAVLCHHAHFDGLILAHHYGIRPGAWLDTLSMGRLMLGNHLSLSLDSLAKHYGLAAKTVPYNLFKGKHWHELAPTTQKLVADGACHDVSLTWDIFSRLAKGFPAEEYPVVDLTVRMFTEPRLRGDVDALGAVWLAESQRKQTLLDELGVTAGDLQSADRFAELLRAEGIEPEIKDTAKGRGYAFAKTDGFLQDLLEHESPRIATLAQARLGIKSTIDQTRAERLGWMATRGPMPVYLKYAGAHTTRWGGGDKVNWQNFRRGGGIRKAVKAPEGHDIVVVDLSQIECRVLNLLAGEDSVLDAFREGRDLYSEGASRFYGRTITRNDKTERHLGKVLELGCGFGMGDFKLRATCAQGALGGPPIHLSEVEAQTAIQSYRNSHTGVVQYWKDAGRMISRLAGGETTEWGPMLVSTGKITLPNGCPLLYPDLEFDQEWQAWRYRTRNGWAKTYGGKLTENVVQALARLVLSQAVLRIKKRLAKSHSLQYCQLPALLTHDDGVWLPKKEHTTEVVAVIEEEMTREPTWLPGIPLACETFVGDRYEK